MFLGILSNFCPLNLLLVRCYQAEIIIVKRLIQVRKQRDQNAGLKSLHQDDEYNQDLCRSKAFTLQNYCEQDQLQA